MSRFLIVAPIAVVITAALFFLMRDMIAGSPEKQDLAERPKIDLGRKIDDTVSKPKDRTIKPPPVEPELQPQTMDPDAVKGEIPTNTKIPRGPVRPGNGNDGPFVIDMGPMDGGASPIIRPKPQYPACGKGTGEVVLDYVVEPDGSIRDVRVIKASSSCFARAAERATTRWKYRPEVVDGKAVRSGRKRVTLVFEQEQ